MNRKKSMALFVVVGIVLLHFISGCSQNRAKIRITKGITINDIANDWDKYNIYYAGSPHRPIGILIDLKNDGIKLMGDRWSKVEDERTLSSLVEAVQPGTSLNTITARSDDKLFGYFSRTYYTETKQYYGGWGYNPHARMVDENTVRVDLVRYNNPLRPY